MYKWTHPKKTIDLKTTKKKALNRPKKTTPYTFFLISNSVQNVILFRIIKRFFRQSAQEMEDTHQKKRQPTTNN